MQQEKFYNEKFKDITKNIERCKTFLIHGNGYESEKMSKKVAEKKKSYSFQVYTKHKNTFKHYGYGVPN